MAEDTGYETIYEQVNMQGQAAMKAAFAINGGASIALLAFIGSVISKGWEGSLLLNLCNSMACFIIGTFFNSLAFGAAYFAGRAHEEEDASIRRKKWNRFNNITIVLTVLGYVLFFIGSLIAYHAFISSIPHKLG